jgi:hypothetical protein
MALFEDTFKGAGLPGLAIGLGVAVLAPVLLPTLVRTLRPVAKTVIRTGIAAWREASAQVIAEARSEMTPHKS